MINLTQPKIADRICEAAAKSLLYEVSATPKPGLVDSNNNGSHTDMCSATFIDSINAIQPWFMEFFKCGQTHCDEDYRTIFAQLRGLGLKAEKDMLLATGDVNTHKGAIFAFSIIIGAYGAVCTKVAEEGKKSIERDVIIDEIKNLAVCSLKDFERNRIDISNGIEVYDKYKIRGARGEAAEGFPNAVKIGLPEIKQRISEGYSFNDAIVITLLTLISKVMDTNMIHRGGIDKALEKMHMTEKYLATINKENVIEIAETLDCDFIEDNMSPGGCADLLAISIFFYLLESINLW